MRAEARSQRGRRRLIAGTALVACLALPVSAQAGRLIVTGHDAESHCVREKPELEPAACAFVGTGITWVRGGAPDPSKPVLILDRGFLDFQNSVDRINAEGDSPSVPYQVVDPRSAEFATLPIDTATYSAVLIASSKNEASDPTPQDLNEVDSTPDTDAINARAADLASFFNAGGGIDVMSGGEAARSDSARYYAFLKITRAGGYVASPSSLTAVGRAIGWQDARANPGELDEINCCLTHVSFELPAPESPLKAAEVDNAGHAITMVAETDDLATIDEPPTTAQTVFAGAPGVPTSSDGGAGTPAIAGSKKAVCVPRKLFRISLRRPRGVRFVRLVIYVNGHRRRTVGRKALGTKARTRPVYIRLSRVRRSRVRLVVTTAAGRRLTYRQTYKPCPRRR